VMAIAPSTTSAMITKDHYRRTLRMLVTLGPACAMPTV
jgi:hypothetical protein